MKNSAPLDELISILRKFPGLGHRSAERIAVKLVIKRDSWLKELIGSLKKVEGSIVCCSKCGSLTTQAQDPCKLCTDSSRDNTILCIVEDPADILMIENAGGYRGRYHALMGKISPINQQSIANLRIEELKERLNSEPIKEVILALNTDVESEATASLLREMFASYHVKISRPAMGMPAGSGIAYTDPVTLSQAIKSRQKF